MRIPRVLALRTQQVSAWGKGCSGSLWVCGVGDQVSVPCTPSAVLEHVVHLEVSEGL